MKHLRHWLFVLAITPALLLYACLDEWQAWRRNRCVRAAVRRRP